MKAQAPHAIVLFDGSCVFCEGAVSFIARRDSRGYFKFGASQTPRAQELLKAHGVEASAARSIVLIEDGEVYLKSTASLRVARRLSFPWNLASALLAVPRPIRDAVYNVVAAVRHRVAGQSEVCGIPPAPLRDRLI